jgi:hypothetical protein
MKKLIVAVIALAIFAGVGLLMAENNRSSALRVAETGRTACFASQGYIGGDISLAPEEVRDRCGRYFQDYNDGETMRYVQGGLIGLAAALVFLALAWFFMFRRRDTGGTPPPAA